MHKMKKYLMPYEAQGAAGTYRRAEAAIRKARSRTPAAYLAAFVGTITEFDDNYVWDWVMIRPMPMMVKVWKDGQWVAGRQVWNETEQRYQTVAAA
jgi:hypothetical protein